MGRIRTIKPEIWADEIFGHLSPDSRLTFIGMISLADDQGRFRSHAAAIRAAIFPYDKFELDQVEIWISDLAKSGRIHLYTIDGQRYAYIRNWSKHQKVNHPAPSRIPDPPKAKPRKPSAKRNDSAIPNQVLLTTQESLLRTQESLFTTQESLLPHIPIMDLLPRTSDLGSIEEKKKTSSLLCAAIPETEITTPKSPTVLTFPCAGGVKALKTWTLTEAKVKEYSEAFPAVDVRQECRKALQWIIDNRRMTARGTPAFLGRWLAKAQNDGPRRSHNEAQRPLTQAQAIAELAREARRREQEEHAAAQATESDHSSLFLPPPAEQFDLAGGAT